MKLLIKNARIIDYKSDFTGDLLTDGEVIKAIGINLSEHGATVIDGTGKVLLPGFVDLHAHFRDPGYTDKEDLLTGQKAAINGGYTTVHLMGNTDPVCSDKSIREDILKRAREKDMIDVRQVLSVTKNLKGKELIDFDTLPKDIEFLSDDGKGILSNALMRKAMIKAAEHNIGIMVHAEDPDISGEDYRIAEDLITIRDVYLSGKTGCRIHFSHVSTEDALKAIAYGKKESYPLTCEVTPHHISLSDNDYRVNPPIRTERDRKYLIEGIKKGIVDAIATDHAPHTESDKKNGAPGMIGLETAFYIVYKVLVEENNCDLKKVSEIMSKNPADILKIKTGRLEPGYRADLVLIDLSENTTIEKSTICSKSHNTPFLGSTFTGKIETVIASGKILKGKDNNDSRPIASKN